MILLNYLLKHNFLLFTIVCFLLYGNTLQNKYGLDDSYVTKKDNITATGFKSIKTIFTTHYIVEEGGQNTFEYRPLVKLSFAIEHQFFGVKPFISHLINLLLYALSLYILHKILLLIFGNEKNIFCLLCVLIFASIPMHVEAVGSLKSRDILICFILSSTSFLYAYNYLNKNKIHYLLTALILMLGSFFSKLDSLPLIVLFPLLLLFIFPEKKQKILFVLLAFIFSFFLFDFLMNRLIDQSLTKRPVEAYENNLYFAHSIVNTISSFFNTIGFYTKMLLFPNDMACYYGYNTIPVNDFLSFYSILGILTIGVGIYFVLKYIKEYRNPVFIGLVIYFISISMYGNIIKPVPGIVADRFLFNASIGFCIILTYIILCFVNKNVSPKSLTELSKNTKFLLLAVFVFNAFFVISRNKDWKNEITLYLSDTRHQPKSLKLNNLCGNEILAQIARPNSDIPQTEKSNYLSIAEQCLLNALKIDSNNLKALNNLSYINLNYYKNYNQALYFSRKAYLQDTGKFEILYNVALANYNTSRNDSAEKYALKAYEANPNNNLIQDLILYIISQKNDISKNVKYFTEKSIKEPKNKNVNLLLGNIYISKNDSSKALIFYKKALKIDSNDSQLIKIIHSLSE